MLTHPLAYAALVWEPVAEGQVLPAGGRVLIDATEQRVARPGDDATQRRYYSGKKQQHTLKTQIVTDDGHRLLASSAAVPGVTHDKPPCDALHTLARLPDGAEVLATMATRAVPLGWRRSCGATWRVARTAPSHA